MSTAAENETRTQLVSDARVVAVRAAAGCGKTHAAVEAALTVGSGLPSGREVLLLAHTHAAVRVFQRRIREKRARARAMTLDSFIVELVRKYAGQLDLPSPFRPGTSAPFPVLGQRLGELLRQCPSIARAVARHYPFIIFDEHQDARRDQHALARMLVQTGLTRVRLFGDPFQAIYDFAGETISWSDAERDAEVVASLDQPRRWLQPGASPALGRWIAEVRVALANGALLDPNLLPAEVNLQLLSGLDAPPPQSEMVPGNASALLFRVLREKSGSLMILVRNRAHAVGVRRALKRALPVSERTDGEDARLVLAAAMLHRGNAPEQVRLLLELLQNAGVGCTKAFRLNTERALGDAGVNFGKQKKLRAFLETIATLYEDPTPAGLCRVVGHVLRDPPPEIQFDTPGTMRLLARVRIEVDEDHEEALARALRSGAASRVPLRCTSTIHHAKGEECDHVVVMHCSRGPYPDKEDARKLLYVALSRARQSVTIVGSEESPSPLLGLPRSVPRSPSVP